MSGAATMRRYTSHFIPMVYFQDLDMAMGIYARVPGRPDHVVFIPRPLLIEENEPVDDNEMLRWQICESESSEVLSAAILRATVDIHRFTLTGHTITSGSLKEKVNENMLLDPQIGDVYELQENLKQRPVTRKFAESLIEEMAFDHDIPKPNIRWTKGLLTDLFAQKHGPQGAQYKYDTHDLLFHQPIMTDVRVLHEGAHPVDFKTRQKKLHPWIPAHNPRFVDIFQSALREHLPKRAQKSVESFIEECDRRDLTASNFLTLHPDVQIIAAPVHK